MKPLTTDTLNNLQNLTTVLFACRVAAMESVIRSTKTKAKDFVPDSTSFRERVIKKFMRTDLVESEEQAHRLFMIYYDIIKYENANDILNQEPDAHNPEIERWSQLCWVLDRHRSMVTVNYGL